jgi:hypothetical protein
MIYSPRNVFGGAAQSSLNRILTKYCPAFFVTSEYKTYFAPEAPWIGDNYKIGR